MGSKDMHLRVKKEIRMGQLKRKYHRTDVSGFVCDIADGHSSYGGTIEDVSTGGFRMAHIPELFLADKHVYTVLLSSAIGKSYRVLAKPCWRKKSGNAGRLEMGFRVVDASWEWLEFTTENNSESNFDYEDDFIIQ